MNYIYYAIVLLLFLALVLWGMKKQRIISDGDLLDRYNKLRTFFAIEIIIGHCVKHFQTPLFLFENFLCISVAFFFFVSAYGMAISYGRKENYLKGFLRGKCGYILLINLIAYVASALISVIFRMQTDFYSGPGDIIKNFFTSTNWYIWELIGFYILFYLIYRWVPKYRWLVAALVTILVVIVMYQCHIFEPYYTAALAFPFGLLMGENHEKLQKMISERYFVCWVISGAVLVAGMCCFITPAGHMYRDVFLRNIMGMGVILVLGMVLCRFVCDNAVLRWLNRYTTEMYIFQFIWLQITAGLELGFKLKLPVVLVATIVTAMIFHKLFQMLKHLCSPKKRS